jgi:lipoprotein-releasing system permease protein
MSLRTALLFSLHIFKSKKTGGNEFRHHMLSSILGIALSIIPVIVVLEVSSGMIEGITARFIEFDTFHFQIRMFYDIDNEKIKKIKENILAVPEVQSVTVERQGLGLIFSGNYKNIVNVRAVPDDLYDTDAGFRQYFSLVKGSFALDQKKSVIIGKSLAEKLKLKVGDTLKILTYIYSSDQEMTRVIPRPNRLKIVGIYSIGYQELDKVSIFISTDTGKRMLAFNQSEQFLKIKVRDPFKDFRILEEKIQKSIENKFDVGTVHSWYAVKENHYKAYETTKWLLFFIMMLIVLVAAFNIFSSMVMVVMDKIQEIGILKSMGAGPSTITFSFMVLGFLSGFTGTISGMVVGLLIAVNINQVIKGIEIVINFLIAVFKYVMMPFMGEQNVDYIYLLNPEYYLEVIPIRLDFFHVALVGFLTLILSVFFAYFPARRAGKIKPLEVIRKY